MSSWGSHRARRHAGFRRPTEVVNLCLSMLECLLLGLSVLLVAQVARLTEKLKRGNQWHFFISHFQANGGDQCAVLNAALTQRGWHVWYDNQAEDLTAEGMRQGVRESAVLVGARSFSVKQLSP